MIQIGTSGWSYKHWKGKFYPERLAQANWLGFYSKIFSTVEINATFYRRQPTTTFEKWYKSTPTNFKFSVKAPRYITHIKRLKNSEEALSNFYKDVHPLRDKLSALLFQLPPNMKFNPTTIKNFLRLLNPGIRSCIEIRNSTFHCEDFFSLLKEYNVALCISDTANRYPSLIERLTADFFYIRLHGSKTLYRSCYTLKELEEWAEKIRGWNIPGFIYFDNDAEAYATTNAKQLLKLIHS